jgi:hypothetical protein
LPDLPVNDIGSASQYTTGHPKDYQKSQTSVVFSHRISPLP